MELKVNDLIIHEEKIYKIVWIYASGYIEIKENDSSNLQTIKLVTKKEIKPLLTKEL